MNYLNEKTNSQNDLEHLYTTPSPRSWYNYSKFLDLNFKLNNDFMTQKAISIDNLEKIKYFKTKLKCACNRAKKRGYGLTTDYYWDIHFQKNKIIIGNRYGFYNPISFLLENISLIQCKIYLKRFNDENFNSLIHLSGNYPYYLIGGQYNLNLNYFIKGFVLKDLYSKKSKIQSSPDSISELYELGSYFRDFIHKKI